MTRWLFAALLLATLGLAAYRTHQLAQPLPAGPGVAPVRVDVLVLREQRFRAWAFAEGTAEAMRKAFLNFERAGKVVFISQQADSSPIREGSRVFGPTPGLRLGQLLARLDDRENAARVQALEARLQSARQLSGEARAQLNIARNNQQKATGDFARIETLHGRGLVASTELERVRTEMLNSRDAVAAARSAVQAASSGEAGIAAELNQATVSLEKTSLFAPFDGVISSMNLVENNYYYPPTGAGSRRDREADSAIVVVDDSRYEVRLEVPEFHASHIREGQPVYLARDDRALYRTMEADGGGEMGGGPGGVVMGRVWSVSPALSLQQRAQRVKVRTEGDVGELRDGLFVRAWITTHDKPAALALPLPALSFSHGKPYAFVIDDQNRAQRRWLSLGLRGLRSVEVTGGVAPGERVVVRGQHLLSDDGPVQIVASH